MKKLIAFLFLALPLAANAQTTNINFAITVEEGTTRTNTFTFSLSPLQVVGVHAAYVSYLASDTNNTATFRGFARQYSKDLLGNPLGELGKAYQFNASKIDKITQSIEANWENASAADRKLLTDWLAKYPVP